MRHQIRSRPHSHPSALGRYGGRPGVVHRFTGRARTRTRRRRRSLRCQSPCAARRDRHRSGWYALWRYQADGTVDEARVQLVRRDVRRDVDHRVHRRGVDRGGVARCVLSTVRSPPRCAARGSPSRRSSSCTARVRGGAGSRTGRSRPGSSRGQPGGRTAGAQARKPGGERTRPGGPQRSTGPDPGSGLRLAAAGTSVAARFGRRMHLGRHERPSSGRAAPVRTYGDELHARCPKHGRGGGRPGGSGHRRSGSGSDDAVRADAGEVSDRAAPHVRGRRGSVRGKHAGDAPGDDGPSRASEAVRRPAVQGPTPAVPGDGRPPLPAGRTPT